MTLDPMKQILIILVFLFLGLNLGAQSKFSLGPIYSIGASTILSNRPMSEINGGTPIVSKMGLKMSMGAGLRAEYSFSDKWVLFLQTGFQQPGRPCIGSWLHYGLGSENQNLPSFIVMISSGKESDPTTEWRREKQDKILGENRRRWAKIH